MEELFGSGGTKKQCNKCGFKVNPNGHTERCSPPNAGNNQANRWSKQTTEAWINDSVLRLDVQLGLLFNNTPSNLLGEKLSNTISNANLAKIWRQLGDTSDLAQPTGTSDHNLGTAFECNYKHAFRRQMLLTWFGETVTNRILDKNPGLNN